jgi:exodeoxyribonuclease VII large subunit
MKCVVRHPIPAFWQECNGGANPMHELESGRIGALGGSRSWEVGALLRAVGDQLQDGFGAVQVRGELSGFSRAASGHCYFLLKSTDGSAALRCAMFRRAASLVDFAPADGMAVELRGRLTIYEPRGELQMVVEGMRRAGAGALMEQFLRLKARLEAQGLFDAARKRALPGFPRRIGVITSLGAAALHDVLTALQRRAPQVEVIVYPSLVQGADAPAALLRALAQANARAEVDVLLLCRGGGSLEDLWAFNDEALVRAVAASALPVVCGVGHETDFTLCDFAADLRAPTPTAAAELVAPERRACLQRLQHLRTQLEQRVYQGLDRQAQRLDRLGLRLSRPAERLHQHRRRLDALSQRLSQALPQAMRSRRDRLQRLALRLDAATLAQRMSQQRRLELLQTRLEGLDPQQVLARGFAWLADAEGRPLASVRQLHSGQQVQARLADGQLRATVDRIEPAAG